MIRIATKADKKSEKKSESASGRKRVKLSSSFIDKIFKQYKDVFDYLEKR